MNHKGPNGFGIPVESTHARENRTMKTSTPLAPAVLLAVFAGPVSALSRDTTVTPANIKDQTDPALAVNVSEVQGLKHFEIVVKGKAGEEARFLQGATLTLMKGGRKVASCPVAKTERKGNVVYSFDASPDHLDGSTFKVTYIAHIRVKDRQGKEKWQGMPSGNFMTFPLEEFARANKKR